MQKVLIIEDDPNISRLISYNLKKEKFEATTAESGEEGLRQVRLNRPDIIILDLMLPGIGGLDVCKTLKSDNKTKNVPIIMLTAKSEEIDKIVGFEVGADDYVTKPFSPRELTLRIKAVLKRNVGIEKNISTIKFKEIEIDQAGHAVRIGNKEIILTLTEFKLLSYLISNKGKVISRDSLLNNVWGYESDITSRTVDTHITRLREKLGIYEKYLKSIRGVGYQWADK